MGGPVSLVPRGPTQADHRWAIDVGPVVGQVSPVMFWYRHGFFKTDDEARGAFFLAYQQGLDGMGRSTPEWMGMTAEEYDGWVRHGVLPRCT